MRGGYKMIDFQGKSFVPGDGNLFVIPGIYDRIEGNYGKPLLFGNIIISDKEIDSFYGLADLQSSGAYNVKVPFQSTDIYIMISETDTVGVYTQA